MAGKKAQSKDVEIEIPAPKFAMLEVVIDGDTPLIAQQMSQKNSLMNQMSLLNQKKLIIIAENMVLDLLFLPLGKDIS